MLEFHVKKQQTVDTYNNSAAELANKFNSSGTRTKDIEEAFFLAKKTNPKVLEIGCGNGRDAAEILKRTNQYLGIDISEKLIQLAREKNPQGKFEIADIENYSFPDDIDIIFAFASLIHVPKENLRKIFADGLRALNPAGIFKLSVKHADNYEEVTQEDEFGIRTYYHYSKNDIEQLADGYKIIKYELIELRGLIWLEIILQKI